MWLNIKYTNKIPCPENCPWHIFHQNPLQCALKGHVNITCVNFNSSVCVQMFVLYRCHISLLTISSQFVMIPLNNSATKAQQQETTFYYKQRTSAEYKLTTTVSTK